MQRSAWQAWLRRPGLLRDASPPASAQKQKTSRVPPAQHIGFATDPGFAATTALMRVLCVRLPSWGLEGRAWQMQTPIAYTSRGRVRCAAGAVALLHRARRAEQSRYA